MLSGRAVLARNGPSAFGRVASGALLHGLVVRPVKLTRTTVKGSRNSHYFSGTLFPAAASAQAGRPGPPQVPQGPTPTNRVGMWARCPITKRADRPRGALWPAGWGDFAWRRPFRAWVWAGPASRPRNFHPHRPPAAPRPANATLRWAKTARNSVKPAC